MSRIATLATTLALLALPGAALAHHKPGHSGGPSRGQPAAIVNPSVGHCPPGLAKKDPPCIPPGQARHRGYEVGDRFDGDLIFVQPDRFGLPPLRDGEAYVRVGDSILRLDRNERLILDIVDLVLN